MMKIAVLDDDEDRSNRWAEKLKSSATLRDDDIVPIDGPAFRKELVELERRRDLARLSTPPQTTDAIELDNVDVLIVDYDLYDLGKVADDEPRSRLTGEEIAYLARCYSSCGVIVALNQFGENVFDLTLRGHPESFADLNIGSNQLHNPGLWGGEVEGFRPWQWPNLLVEPQRLNARAVWLASRLDEPVLEALGLDNEHVALSREALRFLGRGDPRRTTFADFVADSGQGLDRHDLALDDLARARIAASRIGKWLERLVLGGQDVLVDGPHLASRFPSLLDSQHLERWDAVAQVGVDAEALALRGHALDDAAYELDLWLSRPAWYWQRLFEDSRIDEVSDPWSGEPAPYRFCEDVSRFVEPERAREFTAAVPSAYITRYVVDLEAAKAAGATFFADEFSIDRVEYEPAVQFAM